MAMLLVIMAAASTAAHSVAEHHELSDTKVGDKAVVGSSLMHASSTVWSKGGVAQDLAEDPFDTLDDIFAIKVPIGSASLDLGVGATSFWISCSQDIIIFAFVLFVVPLIAGKLLRTRAELKKVEDTTMCSVPSKQQQQQPKKRTNVDLGQLTQAVRSGDEAQWRSLLQAVPNCARAADDFGCTALHVAADTGCVEMVKVLLEAGADVDVKDAWEETPLHFAARKGNVKTCELLLAKGAELDALNSEDMTPLVASAKAGSESVCQFLLDRGATCGGLSDADIPPLLSSLLMYKMLLSSTKEQAEQ